MEYDLFYVILLVRVYWGISRNTYLIDMGNIMEYLLFDLPCTIKHVKEVAILSGKTPFQWAQMEGLGRGKWNELNWMLLKKCVRGQNHKFPGLILM